MNRRPSSRRSTRFSSASAGAIALLLGTVCWTGCGDDSSVRPGGTGASGAGGAGAGLAGGAGGDEPIGGDGGWCGR